jgi:O-antigen/teichoic acid export membrane protein
MIVSFIIPFISYGGVFANQYSISEGLYKEFSIPYYFGAVFSIAMNFVLVPYMGSIGGTIVITVTEFCVCFLRMFLVRKRIDWKKLLSGEWKFAIALIITCFSMVFVHFSVGNIFLNLAIKSAIMFIEYLLLLVMMKDNFIYKMLLGSLKK